MKNNKPETFTKLTKINSEWVIAGRDPFPPEPDRMRTDPSPQDRQINPNPTVDRMSQGKFYVRDIVSQPWAGQDLSSFLSAECSYCHKTIEIHLRAPLNVGKFAKDEACRVALLLHLRTEHPTTKKKQL